MSASFEPGDLVRSVYRGRVRQAVLQRFVGVDDGRLLLYCAPGARGKWMGRDPGGRYLERRIGDDEPRDLIWSQRRWRVVFSAVSAPHQVPCTRAHPISPWCSGSRKRDRRGARPMHLPG